MSYQSLSVLMHANMWPLGAKGWPPKGRIFAYTLRKEVKCEFIFFNFSDNTVIGLPLLNVWNSNTSVHIWRSGKTTYSTVDMKSDTVVFIILTSTFLLQQVCRQSKYDWAAH